MKVEPQPGILDSITGPIGNVHFARRPSGLSVRAPYSIHAAATLPQALHRQALANSRTLWLSVPGPLRVAWATFVDSLGYSPYAGWNGYNIVALRDDELTTLTPANLSFVPVSSMAWAPGGQGELTATWAYAGPAATNSCSLYYRRLTDMAWSYAATYDAEDLEGTVTGLDVGTYYEAALVPHDNAAATFQASGHDALLPGTVTYEDFDTWIQYDPNNKLSTDGAVLTVDHVSRWDDARLTKDCGADYFGPGTHHRFRYDPGQAELSSVCATWCISNSLQSLIYWQNNSSHAISFHAWNNGGAFRLNLRDWETGQEHYFSDYSLFTTYWVDVYRTDATHLIADVYLDESLETLFHSHQILTTSGRSYRWAYACNAFKTGSVPEMSFTMRNMHFVAH